MNQSSHVSSQFNDELEKLRTRVLQMGGMVELQLMQAANAYSEDDMALAAKVVEDDRQVDALEKTIDDICVHVIAKRQPAASDLRMVMGVSKIVTNLERAGDEAKKIAKGVRRIHERGMPVNIETGTDVHHLADAAATLLRRALDGFARLDTAEAKAVIADDEEINREFKSIIRQLITYMMEDPRTITNAIDILTIARAIERIGDHATNIGEQVIYIAEGRDVRHGGGEAQ